MKHHFNQKKLDEFFVTVFYIGKAKYAPGTMGSLFALLILLIDPYYLWIYSIIIAITLFLASLAPISRYEKLHGWDNSSIVIDEVIGMLIIFSNPFLNIDLFWGVMCFILFRVFDILKPFPINKLNSKEGAFWVIADDILAGLITSILIQILQFMYRITPFIIKMI